MSKTWNYRSGDWWVLCDVCSKKTKASKIKQRWDGLLVCPEDYEHRHPQDYIKVRQDKITVPFMRPRSTDVFGGFDQNLNPSTPTYANTLTCTPMSRFAIAGEAVSGCVIAGILLPGGL